MVRIGSVIPPSTKLRQPLLHLLGRAEDEHFLDRLPGRRGRRRLAVAGLPGLDHRVDLLAVAEPAVEGVVDRDGDVGGEHEAGQRLDLLALAGDADEAAEQLEARRRVPQLGGDLGQAGEGKEVGEGAVGPLDRQSSIFPRSAASTIGTRCAGAVSSLKPVSVRSPSSAARRKSTSPSPCSAASRRGSRSSLRRSGPRRSRCRARSDRARRRRAPRPPAPAAPGRAGRRRRSRFPAAPARSRRRSGSAA